MNAEKSQAYKKLVADMQKQYPIFGKSAVTALQGNSKKASSNSKDIARNFYQTFDNDDDFFKTLADWGLTWRKTNEPKTKRMWAIYALSLAIEDGFNPFNAITKKDSPVELFAPVVNGENICKEINLYTYWQGFGYAEKTPKIKYLLVAQDWGNLFRATPQFFQDIKTMNETGKWIKPYNKVPKGNGTNENLFRLFEVLNRDLLKLNDDVFFTNFCLGYRSGKEVGGMTKKLMMQDAEIFKKLCEILEPENILCLGQITFECVYESLTGKNYSVKGSYNNFIENHEEFIVRCGNVESKIFPLAHCGYMGTMNRNKNLPKHDDRLFYQKQDWKKIIGEKKFATEFTRKFLSNKYLTKKFFADARFIHTSASGAMGEPGIFEVWTKNFEHYICHWIDSSFDVKKFEKAFMKDKDTPHFHAPVKNGWCFHYMGCGNNFYIKEELNDAYLQKFDEGQKNGAGYPCDEDIFPVEKVMLEVLNEDNFDDEEYYSRRRHRVETVNLTEEQLKEHFEKKFTWHEGEFQILHTKSDSKQNSFKKTALYGAIIGDIVGSRFEGRGKKIKTKDFDFFAPNCRFTDDTVMTVAVAEVFLQLCGDAIGMNILDSSTEKLAKTMQLWGKKYPHGYGGRFKEWLFSDNPKPYNSFGNGSAMRVSAVGWAYNDLNFIQAVAQWTAEVTHNHPEGIKGAKAVAVAICLARTEHSKKEIKNYIEKNFGYDLSRKLDDIRPIYKFDVTCQGSVPEAIIAFLESTDFEDAVRNAVSLGGDSDTLAAITGSIAEAFYGIPENLIKKCREYLPQDILEVVDKFNEKVVDNLLMQEEIETDAEAGYFDDANDIDNKPENKKMTALYGAILGDIIGVPFEFSEIPQKSKDFQLFSKESNFSDDTVMTIAIADAILKTGHKTNVADRESVYRNFVEGKATYKDLYATFNGEMNYYNNLYKNVKNKMQQWGKKYPHAGYGGSFRGWLKEENPKPYDSLGNGSAMRVSAAGWLFESMFDTREVARYTSLPTHNHPDGVRGAEAVASAIYLARHNKSKQEIKNYLEIEFDYDLSRNLEEVRKTCVFNETCPISVPEAIIAFLESTDFEDAIRNAVSLGGDTDTQAAIAGSIAEAFYGIPENLVEKCREYLPQDILAVIDKFNLFVG